VEERNDRFELVPPPHRRPVLVEPKKAEPRPAVLRHLRHLVFPLLFVLAPESLLENGLSDGEEEGVDEAEVAEDVLTRLVG
jgi:hypothetical protein